MIPIIEDAILGTDLDGQFNDLLNIGALIPVPLNLATSDDPRLTDSRVPLPGSVTDASVAPAAGIVQSKLSLDGQIPTAWLGATAQTAAQGDLAEYLANKNQPGGYAGLDGTGKIPAANLPGAVGTGTVTSVGLVMAAEFIVVGSPVTGAGVFSVGWASQAQNCWFGNPASIPATPKFNITPLPVSLIPNLDASVVTSGVFAPTLLPVAVGLGVSHAAGAVPDPGDGTGLALATDYLARDMTFKSVPLIGPTYQPTLPIPTFTPSITPGYPSSMVISCAVPGATIFYSLTSATSGFTEMIGTFVSVPATGTLYAYAAYAGYNNSPMASTPV